MNEVSKRILIHGEPDVTRAVIDTGRLCDSIEMRADQKSRLATATSELARNILKYADRGQIALRVIRDRSRVGVEIEASDHGPGIDDVELALSDHFSSGGTLGLGLPGVKRMMDSFEIETGPAKGLRVTATLWR